MCGEALLRAMCFSLELALRKGGVILRGLSETYRCTHQAEGVETSEEEESYVHSSLVESCGGSVLLI